MTEHDAERLATISLFQGITAARLRALGERFRLEKREYGPGTVITQGSVCETLFLLVDGTARAEMADPSGRAITVEHFSAPAAIASAIVFSADQRLPVSLIVPQRAVMVPLPRADLRRLISAEELICDNMLRIISNQATFLARRLASASFRSIRAKLAAYLLERLPAGATTMTLDRTIEELSAYFGVSRPSLSRVLMQLAEEGVLRHRRGIVTITDRPALQGMLAE